jgi:hypothetical protein
MRHALRIAAGALFGAGLAVTATVPAGGTPPPSAPAPAACAPVGVVSTSPTGTYDELLGVSALDNSDVWAVGRWIDRASHDQTLIEHWDGTSFARVHGAEPQPNDLLYGVDALSSDDVWAVGGTFPAKVEVYSTLIEQWNGTAWSVVPSPAPATGSGLLRAVAGDAPDDVWAVGTMLGGVTDTQSSTLVEHWDGGAWQVVPSPDPYKYGDWLSSLTVVSPTDVWAVGSGYATKFGTETLVEHWDGTQWSVVSSPDVGIDDGLSSISAVGPSDLWAVGDYFENTPNGSDVLTLAEHFDGAHWTVVPTPDPSATANLHAVQALSSDDVWAVGDADGQLPALVEHWNGTAWHVVPEPSRPGNVNFLFALSAGSSPGLWAVGSFNGGNGGLPLVEHFCGTGP